MSIKPPSDLLLDVAKAADPAAAAAAAERLAKIGGQSGVSEASFRDVLDGVSTPAPLNASRAESAVDMRVALRPSHPVDAKQKAYQGLEALLLQNIVETMMPKDSDLFGEGSAGVIWRSMLAHELGADLAEKVDLGIKPRYLNGAESAAAHRGKSVGGGFAQAGEVASFTSKHA